MTAMFAVPGFPDAPVAIATLENGSNLLLDLSQPAVPRVAGTFLGPIGTVEVSGEWALTVDTRDASVYRVLRGDAAEVGSHDSRPPSPPSPV